MSINGKTIGIAIAILVFVLFILPKFFGAAVLLGVGYTVGVLTSGKAKAAVGKFKS